MGKKIISIILVVVLVLGLVFVVFLNSRIIRGDMHVLGASHSFKITHFDGVDLNDSDGVAPLVEHIGIAQNGKMYTHYVKLVFFDIYDNVREYSLIAYFNILEGTLNGTNIADRIVYLNIGYGNDMTETRIPADNFFGEIFYLTGQSHELISISKGSYFTYDINGYNFIDLIIMTTESLENCKPNFNHFENGYDVGDLILCIADLFYFYPQWLIYHISVPIRIFGGVFNW